MVNQVTLLGRLGRDPEMRFTGNGKAVTTFSVATDRGFGDDKQTDWHRVVCWEKLAETTNQYLQKGRQVYVQGRIQYRTYTDREGNERQATEVVASVVRFLGSSGSSGSGSGEGDARPPEHKTRNEPRKVEDPYDDIPF